MLLKHHCPYFFSHHRSSRKICPTYFKICLTYFKICQTYFFQSPGPFLKVPTPMYINGDAHAAMNGFL